MPLTYGFLIPDGAENSQEFSAAIHALFGDGVTNYGGKYALSLGGGFRVTLATGFVIANGRYVNHDESFYLNFPPSGNNADRYDAIAAHVDYAGRNAEIAVLIDVDPENPMRNDEQYNIHLYVVRIRRGSTILTQNDIQDTRGEIMLPLSSLSNQVEYVYQFTGSGIDEVVDQLIEKIKENLRSIEESAAALEERIKSITSSDSKIGELQTSRRQPTNGGDWLLCDGAVVPEQYSTLFEMLGGTLPHISRETDRYKTYIYAGAANALAGKLG